jgi:hypothetical protein
LLRNQSIISIDPPDLLALRAVTMLFNIKSDRGTWRYDIAATCFGKVRTPCDGGYMSEIQSPKNCGSYLPGYMPHWIQARKGWEDQVNLPSPGRRVSTSDDGAVIIEVYGEQLRLWNYETEREAEAAAETHGTITY